jgi:hypothetical protein
MKNIFAIALLVVLAQTANAQSYGGASISYNKAAKGCATNSVCSASPVGGSLYVGAKMSDSLQADLSVLGVDSVEAGLFTLGQKSSRYTTRVGTGLSAVTTNYREHVESNALYAAAVGRMVVAGGVNLTGRLGLAYVSSTLKTVANGISMGATTSNRIAPLLGVGVDYDILDDLALVSRFDFTRRSVANYSSNVFSLSAGVQYKY